MNKCKMFLETYHSFEWFIIKYFGQDTLNDCLEFAKLDMELELLNQLNLIWFFLPDNIFNIKENPKGWIEFLNIIEE